MTSVSGVLNTILSNKLLARCSLRTMIKYEWCAQHLAKQEAVDQVGVASYRTRTMNKCDRRTQRHVQHQVVDQRPDGTKTER